MKPGARIDRLHHSWRVRVPGHPAKYFNWRAHGGRIAALEAARAWRDARWDGKSQRDRHAARNAEIRELRGCGLTLAEIATRYGLSAQRVGQIVKTHPDRERSEHGDLR